MAKRGRKPGPSQETRDKLVRSAGALFIADGLGALTPSRIHAASGIARSTITRTWPTAEAILAEIMSAATKPPESPARGEDLVEDLEAAFAQLVFRIENRPIRAFLGATLHLARHSEANRAAPTTYLEGLLHPFESAIALAVTSGVLCNGSSWEMTFELVGPFFLRHVLLGRPVQEGDVSRRIAAFVDTYRPDA